MTFKSVTPWWPLCLLVLSGAAHADLEPFSFGASETLQHQSNVARTSEAESDWLSTTEFTAALDQAIGRQRLTANGLFDINRYKNFGNLNANEYSVAAALNWETVGDLSGAIGGDSQRRQYFYGVNGEFQNGSAATTTRNLQTDNHVFANAQLGGLSRWSLLAGADASQRKYSDPLYDANEERQWSAHAGTNYATSPDLSFGITGSLTRGTYPNFVISGMHDDFKIESADVTTKWQVSGVSKLDASLGYTRSLYTGQPTTNFVNGSLNYTWTPPSRFSVVFGLSRDSSANAGANGSSAVDANNLTGHSINTNAHLSVTYELTAKTSLVANLQYLQRRYKDAVVQTTTSAQGSLDGSNRTTQFGLSAHYKPTRITDLSCSAAREIRNADASIVLTTPNYTDTILMCTAAIKFD